MKYVLILSVQLLKRSWFIIRHNKVPVSSRITNGVLLINCNIGEFCYIGRGGVYNSVKTGNYCSLAPNVIIGGMEHSYWAASTSTHLSNQCISGKTTIIGNDVWIGANAVIRQGVIIGDGAIIGAGSVVTKDVPENSIVCGVPAKFLRNRFELVIWEKVKISRYWDYNK